MRGWTTTSILFVALVCAACSSESNATGSAGAGGKDAGTTPDSGTDTGTTPDGGACPGIPATAAGAQLEWLIGHLTEAAAPITAAEFESHFGAVFKANTSLVELQTALDATGTNERPLIFRGLLRDFDALRVQATLAGSKGGAWALDIQVGSDTSGAPIESLESAAVPSWAELDATLAASPHQVHQLVAEIDAGVCTPIHAFQADQRRAIGSVFKLYVLGALAEQIQTGSMAWTDPLALVPEHKSVGAFQAEPDGTIHTLLEYAKSMISTSDNTATDHLLFHVGRETVEAELTSMGHAEPLVDTPFVAAREAIALKFVLPAATADAYVAADIPTRRAMLVDPIGTTPVSPSDEPPAGSPPSYIDSIEWFANANELCAALAKLQTLSAVTELAPLLDVMVLESPGADKFSKVTWQYIGFKPGSEPGVASNAYLMQRCDGRWFAVIQSYNDTTTPDILGFDATIQVALVRAITAL